MDLIDFQSPDVHRRLCLVLDDKCSSSFYVNEQFICLWSPVISECISAKLHMCRHSFPDDSILSASVPSGLLASDVRLFLNVIHAQELAISLPDLRRLMGVAVKLECSALAIAIMISCLKLASSAHLEDLISAFEIFTLIEPDFDKSRFFWKNELSLIQLIDALLYRCNDQVLRNIIGRNGQQPYLRISNFILQRVLEVTAENSDSVVRPRNSLRESFAQVLEIVKRELTLSRPSELKPGPSDDVELCLSDGILVTNKSCLLACSPVFRSLLCGPFREAGQHSYDLPDESFKFMCQNFVALLSPSFYGCFWRVTSPADLVTFSAASFWKGLYFCPAGFEPEKAGNPGFEDTDGSMQENMMIILQLADKYAVPALIRFCAGSLKGSGVVSFYTKYRLGEMFNCSDLIGYCSGVMEVSRRVQELRKHGRAPWWFRSESQN